MSLAWRFVPSSQPLRSSRLDVLGASLLSPGLALLIYGFSQAGTSQGFGATGTLISLPAGAVLLAGYAYHALHTR